MRIEDIKPLSEYPEKPLPKKWGNWKFVPDGLVLNLVVRGRFLYEVDLERITDSAHMLDWIMQVRMKHWATNAIVGDLCSALMDLFRPQQTICGGGKNKTIDPVEYLSKRIKEQPK